MNLLELIALAEVQKHLEASAATLMFARHMASLPKDEHEEFAEQLLDSNPGPDKELTPALLVKRVRLIAEHEKPVFPVGDEVHVLTFFSKEGDERVTYALPLPPDQHKRIADRLRKEIAEGMKKAGTEVDKLMGVLKA